MDKLRYNKLNVNPDIEKFLTYKVSEYGTLYRGFVSLTLYGGQATGKSCKGRDVDTGLVFVGDEIQRNVADDLKASLLKEGYELCTHNEPVWVHLNMSRQIPDQLEELGYAATYLSKIQVLDTSDPRIDVNLYSMFVFCLPFGLTFGNAEKIKTAQRHVRNLIDQGRSPRLIRDQMKRALDFMY